MNMFGMIDTERTVGEKQALSAVFNIGSIAPIAGVLTNVVLTNVVRAHGGIKNGVHCCLDVALNDDQMHARMKNGGQSRNHPHLPQILAVKHFSDYRQFDAIALLGGMAAHLPRWPWQTLTCPAID